MYSLLDMAVRMFEGSRITWRIKSQYMQARPIQEIRRRYAGQQIASWNGQIDGSQWVPYQTATFVTPPFADFTSGHSQFTSLFAATMTKWFGQNIIKNTITYDGLSIVSQLFRGNQQAPFGDFLISSGTSTVQPGQAPSAPVTLSFSTWNDIANSAGLSRIYGGIHTMDANTSSQTTAGLVDSHVNATWNIMTGSTVPSFIGLSYIRGTTTTGTFAINTIVPIGTATGYDTMLFNTVGSALNATTGVFTAPIAGYYFIYVNAAIVTANRGFGVRLNATSATTGTEIGGNYSLISSALISISTTIIRRLNATDTISIYSKLCGLTTRTDANYNGSNCIIYLLFAN
jgi:hypothetical protein